MIADSNTGIWSGNDHFPVSKIGGEKMYWTQLMALLLGAFLIGLWSNEFPKYTRKYKQWKNDSIYKNSINISK